MHRSSTVVSTDGTLCSYANCSFADASKRSSSIANLRRSCGGSVIVNQYLLPHEKGRWRLVHLFLPRLQPRFEVDEDRLILIPQITTFADVVLQIEQQIDAAIQDVLPIAMPNRLLIAIRAVDTPVKRPLLW